MHIPTLNDYLSVAMPFIGVAFGVHILYVALYYMWGNFLNSPQVYAKAKEELLSLFRTIGIFVSVIIIYNLLILGLGMDFIALAKLSVKSFFWRLLGRYMDIMLRDFTIGAFSRTGIFFFIQAEIFSIEIGGALLAGLNNVLTILHKTLEALFYMLSLAAARYVLLDFAPAAMIYLLPLGFFLRAFPITRKTGSSVIALAITLFFVYPLSVLFTDYLVALYESQKVGLPTLPANPLITEETDGQVLSDFMKYFGENASQQSKPYLEPGKTTSVSGEKGFFTKVREWFKKAVDLVKSIFTTSFKIVLSVLKFLLFLLDFFKPGNPFLSPVGWVLPPLLMSLQCVAVAAEDAAIIFTIFILEITISITMYRNIAMLIGGELRIFGITKVTGE